MALDDSVCTLVPYFRVQDGKLDDFMALGEQMVERTRGEDAVVFYGFSVHEDMVHCREGYRDGQGILTHLENVDGLLKQALEISTLERLEIHAPAAEIDKLREPLSGLNPEFYTMKTGFRN